MSAATAVRYVAEHREHGKVIAKPQGRPVGQFGKLVAYVGFLRDLVQAEPDITLQELANALENTYGVNVHLSSIHRVLVRSGFSYKKRAYGPRSAAAKGFATRGMNGFFVVSPGCARSHIDWCLLMKQQRRPI